MKEKILFTSESVSEGHPDKLCDQISDAVLDACLKDDPNSHVACEVFVTDNYVLVGGEITTKSKINVDEIVRNVHATVVNGDLYLQGIRFDEQGADGDAGGVVFLQRLYHVSHRQTGIDDVFNDHHVTSCNVLG